MRELKKLMEKYDITQDDIAFIVYEYLVSRRDNDDEPYFDDDDVIIKSLAPVVYRSAWDEI